MAILEPDHRQSDRHSLAIWRTPVTLRLAAPDDTPELYRLGELDSRPLPPGPHLIAEREGRIGRRALAVDRGVDRRPLPSHRRAPGAAPRPCGQVRDEAAAVTLYAAPASAAAGADVSPDPVIRGDLRAGDLGEVLAHHGRVYAEEYGVDSSFEGHVAATLARAAARGFPTPREAIRLVELDGEHAGSIALTDEGGGEATIRWFVLSPEVRGRGLGRRLLGEMLSKAAEVGYARVALETFSELEAAAHLYLDHGFEVVSADAAPRWGRDRITYQRYELELSASLPLSA